MNGIQHFAANGKMSDENASSDCPENYSGSKPLFNSTAVTSSLRITKKFKEALNISPIRNRLRSAKRNVTNIEPASGRQPYEDDEDMDQRSSITNDEEEEISSGSPLFRVSHRRGDGRRLHGTTNPFDGDIESLGTTTFSPNLFERGARRDSDAESAKSFHWSIGQLAHLHPADIDESADMHETTADPVMEAKAHNAIEKFWASQKYVIPSPQVLHELRARNESPEKIVRRRQLENRSLLILNESETVATQTKITFPSNFDFEEYLHGCFTYHQDEKMSESNLPLEVWQRGLLKESIPEKERSPFEKPPWYHSDDEMDDDSVQAIGELDEVVLKGKMLSPDISPIKKT